jgi:hypothetical protein
MTGADNLAFNPPPPRVGVLDRRMLPIALNRFPLKQGWDALALGQVLLRGDLHYGKSIGLKGRADCARFYFSADGIRNLFATLTRSGSHWSLLGIQLALDLAAGGAGTYHYETGWVPDGDLRYTKLDWRTPQGTFAAQMHAPIVGPVVFHSHHPYYRIRSAQLKNMKIVILLRNILESMESKYFKLGKVPDHPDGDDDRQFPWEKMIDDGIEFYNSWGDVIRWHPNCRVFKYEELLADPAGVHRQMVDFWGLDVPAECIEEAFSRVTKAEMKKKFDGLALKSQMMVSYRKTSEKIPDHRLALIKEKIREKLVYDFGYDFD